MFSGFDKRILNIMIICILTCTTFGWTFWIFHKDVNFYVIICVICFRILASIFLFKDYSLSWSKATSKTFLLKSFVYSVPFFIYIFIFYQIIEIAFFLSELAFFILGINFLVYSYNSFINRVRIKPNKTLVIYGAGDSGVKLYHEFKSSIYKFLCFIDDNEKLQQRSVDGVGILSKQAFIKIYKNSKFDLLVIAVPTLEKNKINIFYDELKEFFLEIKVLPKLSDILQTNSFMGQLKNISIEDLLARAPKDLDEEVIKNFIKEKIVLITGAGGSIGSELSKLCFKFGAKKLILVDNSEFNLYKIGEELEYFKPILLLRNVTDKSLMNDTFEEFLPQIVIHAAAYKHVPMGEINQKETIYNNICGTKTIIDLSIKYKVQKFVLISTDKAVRPTNVMGATKRICELYAQNVNSDETQIVAVRFGNVLGSSGSVIPKFWKQIRQGGPISVTHPEITRYFMLIDEACKLVLQAASLGNGGEIFILDMGEAVKIVDLAKKMIQLSGKFDVKIEFCGLRAGEKLYEELLIKQSDKKTQYNSIMISKPTFYDIKKLDEDIKELLNNHDKLSKIKYILPEFKHNLN